jgi:L-asparagine transporter-like permease
MKVSLWERVKTIIGMLLIVITISGTLGEKTSRLGLYVSLLFIVIIGICAFIMVKKEESKKSV